MEIFDDMGVRDPEVRKFRRNNLKLSRPRFNFCAKQKSALQNFVLEGHPTPLLVCAQFHTTLPFQTPFPHANLDELATPLFSQPASPG